MTDCIGFLAHHEYYVRRMPVGERTNGSPAFSHDFSCFRSSAFDAMAGSTRLVWWMPETGSEI
jgi:hypothetical protein